MRELVRAAAPQRDIPRLRPVARTCSVCCSFAASAAGSLSELLDNQLVRLAGDAGVLVGDLRGAVRANQSEVRAALGDLRQASRSLKELARELRQRPSRLLFSKAPEDRELPRRRGAAE